MGDMKEPELGESNPLGNLYRKRVAENRDLTVLVADWNLERGSGKTTLALRMAAAMDRTEEGVTPDKATLSPEELTEAYTREPPGSSLILDEGEAAISNRRSMSGVNEALRKIVGMGRVEEEEGEEGGGGDGREGGEEEERGEEGGGRREKEGEKEGVGGGERLERGEGREGEEGEKGEKRV